LWFIHRDRSRVTLPFKVSVVKQKKKKKKVTKMIATEHYSPV